MSLRGTVRGMANHGHELGPEQLKALTHPLRIALLRTLRADGPATATTLAQRLGESSGATSYHLRQLARHGFVEDDTERGDGRDRWWRAAFGGHRVDTGKWLDDPEQRGVVALYTDQVVRSEAEQVAAFVAEQGSGEWSREWVDAAAINSYRLTLTPERLRRLVDDVDREIDTYREDGGAGAEQVVVQLYAFPRRPRGTEEGS